MQQFLEALVMRFDEALRHVLKHEGGYVNHPSDPGGETNQGITVAVARSFGYPGPMASIPPMVVRDIYLAHYWLPCRCDSLPPQIRLDVFDGAVNSGVSRSIKWLQAAVGADADGLVGPQTLANASLADPLKTKLAYNAERLQFLTKLGIFDTFGRGWVRRIADNLAVTV